MSTCNLQGSIECDANAVLKISQDDRIGQLGIICLSILIKESVLVCNANKLPLFGDIFSTPRKSSRTTASLPSTFNVHCTFGGNALEAQVAGTRQTPLPQRDNDRPGSAGLANPSIYIIMAYYS